MNTDAPKTFTTAYNAKRAAGAFLIANRMDPATEVKVIKLFDKAYTYSLPLDAAPVADAEELEQAQHAVARSVELLGEFEAAAVEPAALDAAIAATVDVETETRPADVAPDDEAEDEPMVVPNAAEAAAVAELEAAAQAKAAKRKPRLSHDERIAARLASTEQPAPPRANKGKPARKQREPKAADAPVAPRVKRADGLTEGSAMAKLVDYATAEPRTNAELCAHVGWAQCLPMLRKGAEKTGRRFLTAKVQGQPTRYQLVAVDAA